MSADTARERTVLVVDDDFRVAQLHADLVEARQGLTALPPVHTARAARAAVAEHAPDLLLLDVHLPDQSGIALLRELDTDAFVVSAASDGATVRRALHAGALGYLIKPFEARLLGERLDAYVRFRNVLREDRAADQEAVERALRILHSGDATAAQPSRSATEQLVLARLAESGAELSALEVAERAGISRATAQRYLSGLAGRGLVEMTLSYGTTGRPEHRYRAR
ncbi:two-component system response regulator [Rathayibacter sp. AY1G1]|jgi:two-component system CitB family response regulator|uniref:response regulator n=1 Tax=unclassified Rathayibacter TaxID=2609250 RepID=UPI000CE91409|nr:MULTISPECIES: response regulator [unclassified Rathayibacter]PPF16943.1 two-component system response regulator [Rathayibacter sp. AY1A4]PPF18561.1 two-component system response regulator [Rathayibacter sp. AY1A7]PPF31379.1 two-component system response regulator [Rathayibacter sp. AY1A3]PPF47794.1 two-component system response regulator [Rathayibacter sp. AY1A1]PPF72518.1 two-component system response regulator [Rathayibacter sp. AY1E6]